MLCSSPSRLRPLKPAERGKNAILKKESQPLLKLRLVKAERQGLFYDPLCLRRAGLSQ